MRRDLATTTLLNVTSSASSPGHVRYEPPPRWIAPKLMRLTFMRGEKKHSPIGRGRNRKYPLCVTDTPDPMPPITIGVISSTSSRSSIVLQVDMDAALSKYHGDVLDGPVAENAWSESEMAHRTVPAGLGDEFGLGRTKVEDKFSRLAVMVRE